MSRRKLPWTRILRIIGFATIYFCIFVASALFFLLKSYSGSSELAGYLQNPWAALRTIFDYIFFEVPRNPLLMLTLFILMLQSLVLGFVTDWVLRVLLKKRKTKTTRVTNTVFTISE